MPSIRSREEESKRRSGRLAQIKKGPGVFVYDGNAVDTEAVPTPLLIGRDEPLLDKYGMPVLDPAGRQVMKPAGRHATDDEGRVIMGGVPKIVEKPLAVFKLRGVKFPKGEPVSVSDAGLALKLRGMDCFEEVFGKSSKKNVEEDDDAEGAKQNEAGLSWQELRSLAKERGIETTQKTTKADLIEMLKAAGVDAG
jgi:hypothetical protein